MDKFYGKFPGLFQEPFTINPAGNRVPNYQEPAAFRITKAAFEIN